MDCKVELLFLNVVVTAGNRPALQFCSGAGYRVTEDLSLPFAKFIRHFLSV